MDTNAIVTVFVAVAVGTLCVVPFVLLTRRSRNKDGEAPANDPQVPWRFVVVIGVMVVMMLLAMAGPVFFPGTWWGEITGRLGWKLSALSVVLIFILFVPVLQALGLVPKDKGRSNYTPSMRWRKRDSE